MKHHPAVLFVHRLSFLLLLAGSALQAQDHNPPDQTLEHPGENPNSDGVSQTQLNIESIDSKKLKLTILKPEKLASDEVYVLESSQDLKNWSPYKIFVSTQTLTVPRRFDSEFFRVVKRKLPKGTASGSIHVSNYTPPHWETRSDGTRVFVPESGTYIVRGMFSVPSSEVNLFPSPYALYPPTPPHPNNASLEAGIVGSDAGKLIYTGQTSHPFQSQTFKTRAEAQAYLDSVKVFVVPRIL